VHQPFDETLVLVSRYYVPLSLAAVNFIVAWIEDGVEIVPVDERAVRASGDADTIAKPKNE
jgi:hypothetical protein